MTPISTNPTCSSAVNTTSETDIISTTIAANSLADGDYLNLQGQVDSNNSTGGNVTLNTKIYFGSENHNLRNGGPMTAGPVSNFASLWLLRQGANLVIFAYGSSQGSSIGAPASFTQGLDQSRVLATFTPDFTISNVLKVTATLGTASVSVSVTANSAKLLQY